MAIMKSKETWLSAIEKEHEKKHKVEQQNLIEFMLSGGPCDNTKDKLNDDLIIFGICSWKTGDTGVEYIDPHSKELNDVINEKSAN